jgi:ketosteroid isomerase-like protein
MPVNRTPSVNAVRARLIGLVAVGACLGACVSQPTAHTRNAAAGVATSAPTKQTPLSIAAGGPDTAAASKQVIAAEQAFAKTMADRDFKGFVKFLSPDAVFFSGSEVAHGAAAVAAKWEPYFSGHAAPFGWAPDHVEVLASGDLALSTGPVYEHRKVVGRFNSVWRLASPNNWLIVFDKGEAVCEISP